MEEQIAELKESVDMLKKFQQGYIDRIINLEEVLQKLIKKHKIKPTPGYVIMDPKTKEFNIELDKLLEKLDVPKGQTERKGDKQMAKEYFEYMASGGEKDILQIQKEFRESPCPHENIEYGLCLECGLSTNEILDSKLSEPRARLITIYPDEYIEVKLKKAEPENSHALDSLLHGVAPIPLPEVHKLLKQTEERVRGATREELISEFLEDLNSNMWIKDIIKKWQGRLKE